MAGLWASIRGWFAEWANDHREQHEEHRRRHLQFHEQLVDLQRRQEQEGRSVIGEFRRAGWHGEPRDFDRYRRHIRYSRPVIVAVNLVFWFMIFRYLGFRVVTVSVVTAMSLGVFAELMFLVKLGQGVFDPISRLRAAVENVADGDYDVTVERSTVNEINALVDSFNSMAARLRDSERVKSEYEANRRALVANISHDLKTPITTIQGYTEAMIEHPSLPPETLDKYHRAVRANAQYMNKLVDDLFLFSELDLQRLDLRLETVDLKAFMDDLVEELGYELEEGQGRLVYRWLAPAPCPVRIDGKRINQVVRNVVGNALKHGPKGGTVVSVSVGPSRGASSASVDIAISDNGPGIAPDKLPHIFERFYRVDDARTKDLTSTGLGLAIAKELMEAHGGTIGATSRIGDGTCITATLPVVGNGGESHAAAADYRGRPEYR